MYSHQMIILVTALVALVQGYPGGLFTEQLTLSKVADVVHAVPAAFSHQSQTVVHARSNVVSDIVSPVAAVEKSAAVVVDDAATVAAVSPAQAAPAVVAPVATAVVAPAAVVPPSEISFHGTPLLKSLASATSFQTYLEAPVVAVTH